MSFICHIDQLIHRAKEDLSPDLLIIILGPTASGKTKAAVELARAISGEVISADSRQVYRQMNIGTGKDLHEYGNIRHHLINIKSPGEKYNADLFRNDFFDTYDDIVKRGKQPILCGGTGSYIHTILRDNPYAQIPKDISLQERLSRYTKEELIRQIEQLQVPSDLKIDTNSHKRLVRSLEILQYIRQLTPALLPQRTISSYLIFGLDPSLSARRTSITSRLRQRLETGLILEVENLINQAGLSHSDLVYYGLEYKYVSYYLQGHLTYETLFTKLNTEIHRYAKRQMTYFRKMEKEGIEINWLSY